MNRRIYHEPTSITARPLIKPQSLRISWLPFPEGTGYLDCLSACVSDILPLVIWVRYLDSLSECISDILTAFLCIVYMSRMFRLPLHLRRIPWLPFRVCVGYPDCLSACASDTLIAFPRVRQIPWLPFHVCVGYLDCLFLLFASEKKMNHWSKLMARNPFSCSVTSQTSDIPFVQENFFFFSYIYFVTYLCYFLLRSGRKKIYVHFLVFRPLKMTVVYRL